MKFLQISPKWPSNIFIRAYRFLNNLSAVDLHAYLREWWCLSSRLWLRLHEFLSGPECSLGRSFRPTDPHTSPHRAAADSTDSLHYCGPARKVHSLVMEMHRRPPGFSGFLAALQFILPHAKQRKKTGECVWRFSLRFRCPEELSALMSVCLS